MMTIEEIQKRIAKIESHGARDNEIAHGFEDDLYREFIEHVALGVFDIITLSNLAKEVLKSQQLDFDRYYS